MSQRVKANVNVLRMLARIKPSARKDAINALDKEGVCTICECAHNTLKGNVNLSPNQKRKLARHRKILRRLCKSGESWRTKKKVIKQAGGFILPLLLPILGSLIKDILVN
jgi:hypothetical protein